MPIVDIKEAKQRMCALEKEALAALTPTILCEAFPRWVVKCETFPYWINRFPLFNAEEGAEDYGDEGAVYNYTITSMLIVAHSTSDWAGESEELMDFVTPQVIEYCDARAHMQSVAFPDALLYLRRFSFVTGGFTTVPRTVGNGGIAHGVTFQWRTLFDKPIAQAYL